MTVVTRMSKLTYKCLETKRNFKKMTIIAILQLLKKIVTQKSRNKKKKKLKSKTEKMIE